MRDIVIPTAKPEPPKFRKVLVATPSKSGSVDATMYVAFAQSVKECLFMGIELLPVVLPGEALLQHARNELLSYVVANEEITDLVWADDDIGWGPGQMVRLLSHDVDVVGAAYCKKSDNLEWTVNAPAGIIVDDQGLAVVSCVGTGFLRMSRKACLALWESGKPYRKSGKEFRWAFDTAIVDGELISEDNVACYVLKEAGFDVHLDVNICCSHTGRKTWMADFSEWLTAKAEEEKQARETAPAKS